MTTSSNKTPCVQRVLVLGPDSAEILPAVKEAGLSVVTEDPEAIITYGGDGLLLGSERDWPGIP
ncbi:MAG: hypothetical protein QGH59_08570, partial [Gemmatimonadota bacterium]|nr:hypothetical protein [Gemmatimonadota bacterium]